MDFAFVWVMIGVFVVTALTAIVLGHRTNYKPPPREPRHESD